MSQLSVDSKGIFWSCKPVQQTRCMVPPGQGVYKISEDLTRRLVHFYLPFSFQYGNRKTGWVHYKKQKTDFVKCSDEVFFSEDLVQSYVSLLHHGWLSQEGQSEAYNECHRNSSKVFLFKNFLAQNPSVGQHFKQTKYWKKIWMMI